MISLSMFLIVLFNWTCGCSLVIVEALESKHPKTYSVLGVCVVTLQCIVIGWLLNIRKRILLWNGDIRMLKATLVEVNKWSYTERRNWLECEDVEEFDYIDEEKNEFYKQLFLRREDASDFIKKITEGFDQYWFNIIHSIDDDEETLEYHNGTEWDTEIHITIGNMRIDDSFIESIKSYESGTSK